MSRDTTACAQCRHANEPDARFCEECGAKLARLCATCAHELKASAKFCPSCGAATGRDASPSPPPATARAPRDYTPKHLADKILQSKSALEGERKQVTVLFADVKGSMDLAEQVDPETWHAILDRFFQILADGVHRFEGTVNQYTGDGVMALFGAPIAHEDHAQRACWAALGMRDALARYATEVKREHGLGFSTRMGIHSGEVVVGKIGDDLRMDYTAQGHTVGLAQRMEALASPDTCYLSAATAGLADGYFELEDLGDFQVKGLREPMHVHRLVGPGRARTRFDVSRSRGLTRFVGRDTDMRTLEDALAQARAGTGQVVGVVAQAGTGKSRLCHEFAERCRSSGMTVNVGHALAHGSHVPYLPILEIFRAYFGIADGDDDRTAREKIAGRLLLLDEAMREALPVLFEFLGVPDLAHPMPKIDPEAKQRQIFALMHRIVNDPHADAHHILAVVEDLHWLDAASEAFLARWVDAIAGSSALLVVNFRPEYHADWMQRSWYRQLPLAPLGPEATRALLTDLLGSDPSVASLGDRVHRQTGGNPFFTEEVVQSLVESGHLEGSRGAYVLRTPIDALGVPSSVQAVLAARIDRLPEREKRVLQTAAVIGRDFAEPLLVCVAELPDDEVRAALAALQAGEFIHEQTPFPIPEYAFKHALTQEVALRSQLQERRRRLHATVARAIEAAHPDKLDERAALLGHHWEEAGEPITAATWQTRAGRFERKRDFAASSRHWARVRELVKLDPDSPEAPTLGATACRELLALGFRLDLAHDESDRIFDEGLAWAERTGDPLFAGRLHQCMAVLYATDDRLEPALRHAAEWERAANAMDDPERRACAPWPSLMPLFGAGRLEPCRERINSMLDVTRDHPEWGLRDWSISARGNAFSILADVEIVGGGLDEARQHAKRAFEIGRSVGDLETQGAAWGALARIAFYAGEPDAARAIVRRHVDLAERIGSELARGEAGASFGKQLLLENDARGAVAALQQTLATNESRHRRFYRSTLQTFLAEGLRRVGDLAAARPMAESSLDHARDRGRRIDAIEAALVLSRILRDAEGIAAAGAIGALLDEADAQVADTTARLFTPFVLVERAALAALRGEKANREQLLGEAGRLFADMGATGQAAQVSAQLGSR